MVVYASATTELSWLRALNFGSDAWDLGIYQQALWSTAHGRPFWETPDWETGGFSSLLQVHTVFLLYLLVPFYAIAPSELTLFAAQSIVVAAAAYPLYLLTRDLTRSPRWGLAAALVYLAYTPTLAGNLFDFHAEAFLPLEIFAVVLLYHRGRYLWGLFVATLAFLTFEFATVILAFAGLYFLLPDADGWRKIGGRLREEIQRSAPRGAGVSALRGFLVERRVLASIALLLLSVLAYALLLLVREDWLSPWLGIGPFPSNTLNYVIGSSASSLTLSLGNVSMGFAMKLGYWVLLLALLGFVPLLAPRALLLSVPWFVFTMFSDKPGLETIGTQYGFIAGSTLLVAFAFGLARIHRWLAVPGPPPTTTVGRAVDSRPRGGIAGLRAGLVVGLIVLIAVNLALSPVNPAIGASAFGSAYAVSYHPAPGYQQVVDLVGLIPPTAPVLASDNLFPFVANDMNAYALLWVQDNYLRLPFNATALPPWVLLSANRTGSVPGWLQFSLYNPGVYGVRGVVWSTPVGPVLLFKAWYTGPLAQYGSPPSPVGVYYGSGLVLNQAGFATSSPLAAYPSILQSAPGAYGQMFGPLAFDLGAGTYTFTFGVRAEAADPSSPPLANLTVFSLSASSWLAGVGFSGSYTFADLNTSGWVEIPFTVTVTEPTLDFSVAGYAELPYAVVQVEALSVS